MSIGTPTANSFGGTAFWFDAQAERSRPAFDQQSLVNYIDVPGGNRHIIQFGGDAHSSLSLRIRVPSGSWAAFQARRKTQGSLILGGVAWTATLVDITGIEDSNIDGYVHCTAIWMK